MNMKQASLLALSTLVLAACGGGTVIDQAKRGYLSECPGHNLGKIVNGYFISNFDSKTLWTAYPTSQDSTIRVTAQGDILYVGIKSKALLEVMYNQDTQELSLSKLSINDSPQSYAMAEALVSNMCDKAKGL